MSTKIQDLSETMVAAVFVAQNVTAVTTASVATTGRTADFITGDGDCTVLLATGSVAAGTSPITCSVTVQESTDGTTWTTVVGNACGATTAPGGFSLTSTGASTMTNAVTGWGFQRTKRYLQTIQTTSGTSGSWPVSVTIVEQKKVLP